MANIKDMTVGQLLNDKMTIGEILNIDGCEITAKGEILTISTPTKIITIQNTVKRSKEPRSEATKSSASGTKRGWGRRGPRPNHTFEELAPRVKELRDQNLSQKKVADMLGTSQANVSKIERQMQAMEANGQNVAPNNVVPTEVPIEAPAENQA